MGRWYVSWLYFYIFIDVLYAHSRVVFPLDRTLLFIFYICIIDEMRHPVRYKYRYKCSSDDWCNCIQQKFWYVMFSLPFSLKYFKIFLENILTSYVRVNYSISHASFYHFNMTTRKILNYIRLVKRFPCLFSIVVFSHI